VNKLKCFIINGKFDKYLGIIFLVMAIVSAFQSNYKEAFTDGFIGLLLLEISKLKRN
jgi:translation elongation factor EF-4